MGRINLSIGQVNVTGYLIVVLREAQNPGAEVARLVIPPPVPTTQNVVFTGLNDVVHLIDFRESTDGSTLGLLLSTFVYDVSTGTLMSERRFYQAGGVGTYDPVVGAIAITDPYLLNKTISGVFKEGFRYLLPGVEYQQVGDTLNFLTSFSTPAPELNNQEWVSVEITYATTSGSNTSTSNFPRDIIPVYSSITLGAAHVNAYMEAQATDGVLTITLPDFATIPDGTKYGFSSDGGAQSHIAIKLPAGTFLQYAKRQFNIDWLARGEQLSVMKKGNYLRVLNWSGDRNRVGERVHTDGTPPINGLPEIGLWYNKSEYPRINRYINELPAGDKVSYSDDAVPIAADRTKWLIGNNKFRVPDMRNVSERVTDGTRRAGDFQVANIGAHTITGNFPKIQKSGTSNQIVAIGNINDVNLGTQLTSVSVNIGQETRVDNAAVFTYRIY